MNLYERLRDVALDRPVLIFGMEGWIDAGLGAQAALAAILTSVATEPVIRFDADALLDHRSRRPMVRIENGINTGLNWPEIHVRAGRDMTGASLLALTGPEPDHQWRAFSAAVVEVARELDVRLAVGLGAFPAPVPHTRPVRLAATATTAELAEAVGFVPGVIEVPGGVHAALERAFADAGIPAVGLWARVPHYAAGMPYPAASVALVEGVAQLTDLTLDSSELEVATTGSRHRIDELIAQSQEHQTMVRALEQQVDREEGPDASHAAGFDGQNLPSGDEMAAELERFLRDEGTQG
ncbi:MAG: proteasome assembly chaperone family protein [Acidimicrobiales bacterium]